MPRVEGSVPEVVFLNTSGGLTGGDRLHYDLTLEAGAHVMATTQTAERAYDAAGGRAEARVTMSVGAAGHLAWLPQETILYEASHLDRVTEIDLAATASCLISETIVLGRAAMGENPRQLHLTDRRMVRRAGVPFWAETLRLDAALLALRETPALLGPARAFAVVALLGQGAEDAAPALRRVLTEPDCRAPDCRVEVSGWDGKCVLRLAARDGWRLKKQMVRALSVLHRGALPRVWQMLGETT